MIKISAVFLAIFLLLPVLAQTAPGADPLAEGTAAYDRKDYKAALTTLQPLAEQGNAVAENTLGLMYQQGQGVKRDDAQAMALFQKSAAQGNARAADNLGLMYEKSPAPVTMPVTTTATAAMGTATGKKKPRGAKHNYAEAAKWFQKSAEAGDGGGEYHFGRMSESGLGVPQSWAQAIKWYRKAVDQGNVDAEDHLGMIYFVGLGRLPDAPEGAFWYSLAAAGSESYVTDRDEALKTLNPTQRDAVKKRVENWKPSTPAAAAH